MYMIHLASCMFIFVSKDMLYIELILRYTILLTARVRVPISTPLSSKYALAFKNVYTENDGTLLFNAGLNLFLKYDSMYTQDSMFGYL